MAKIKQLSQHEAQKIAAGEVVERPANIVKELVENSIDAGATRISIYIEDAGKKLIRIVDNGYGMDSTDAHICFDRHATSKITHVDELESINTFGFRGEALASIAAVSIITLITKEENSLEGTHIIVEANTITTTHPVACVTGTDISIGNLFFNVPARKKFLKAPQTEWRAIQLLFNAFCFDYPHIHFTLFADNKQVHNCPITQSIKNRALQLWEPSTHNHLLEIVINEEISIQGIISDHQQYRYDRSSIYFFVNKRWVKNYNLSSALVKGYANVIPQGRYPIAAINITVPAHEVDINIHPRKEEIKFLHPRRIEHALQHAVKVALENNLSEHLKKDVVLKPSCAPSYAENSGGHGKAMVHTRMDNTPFNFNEAHFNAQFTQPMRTQQISSTPFSLHSINKSASTYADEQATEPQLSVPADELFAHDNTHTQLAETDTYHRVDAHNTFINNYHLIGQYKNTYLLVEKEDGLFLVDQHAAHERILYELFSERFTEVATIQLLFPQVVTLSSYDIELVTPHLDIFSINGIIIEQYAHDQLIVQSLPIHLKEHSLTDLIKETIGWIIEYKSPDMLEFKKTINNKLQAQMACKAAVKAGDVLTQEKMKQLLRDLEKTANRFSCPHGRPTGWLISLNDIEKKFKRKL